LLTLLKVKMSEKIKYNPVEIQEYKSKKRTFGWLAAGSALAGITLPLLLLVSPLKTDSPPKGYDNYRNAKTLVSSLELRQRDSLKFDYKNPEVTEYNEIIAFNRQKEDSALVKTINSVKQDIVEMEENHLEFTEYEKEYNKKTNLVKLKLMGVFSGGFGLVGLSIYFGNKRDEYKRKIEDLKGDHKQE